MKLAIQLTFGVGFVFAVLAAFGLAQPERPRADEAFFADKIAPLIVKNCLACHNPERSRGGLDLTTRAALLTGSDNGPAFVPGDSAKSLLVHMIRGPQRFMSQTGWLPPKANVAPVACVC